MCERLSLVKDMQDYDSIDIDDNLLTPSAWGNVGVTKIERRWDSDRISDIQGPVLETTCSKICSSCLDNLIKGKTPQHSLANGLWLREIPEQLKHLTFAEKLLIARVRHNRCVVRVSSGMHKMRANAIVFSNLTPKIYDILPPPKDEINEVLAFISTGPCQPTLEDFKRTPLLVYDS